MSIQISEKAKLQLSKLGVGDGKFLRVTVVAGGCSGNTYSAAIDDTLGDNDKVIYQSGELKAVTDLSSIMHVEGLDVDYSDDLIQSGFRLKNPNASASCGCGASFQV